jgi:hypothetical protein
MACRFASSVVTPWGDKAGVRPYVQPMFSHTTSHCLLTSFPKAKKEREIEKVGLKTGESC